MCWIADVYQLWKLNITCTVLLPCDAVYEGFAYTAKSLERTWNDSAVSAVYHINTVIYTGSLHRANTHQVVHTSAIKGKRVCPSLCPSCGAVQYFVHYSINKILTDILGQTPAKAGGPRTRSHCVAWCVFTSRLSPAPNYTSWWRRQRGARNLPKVSTQRRLGRESNPHRRQRKSDALATHRAPTSLYSSKAS